MRIKAIEVFATALPLREGRYSWAQGSSIAVFDSTLVKVETDTGVSGWGETCPLGPTYLPAYPEGLRTGLGIVAPAVIGLDPREHLVVNAAMDAALKGHGYVKSALDVACWDLAGRASGLPVVTLLGGRQGEAVALYRAISQDTPERMAERVAQYRAEGYRRFQLKCGGRVEDDVARIRATDGVLGAGDLLVADANTGWLPHEAIRVSKLTADLDLYLEQPCATYEECLSVRRHLRHPLVLDEVIADVPSLLRAAHDHALDAVNIKISKVGGLTRARQMRDLCVELGIAMTIEDSWGGDVATATIAHLAHSTVERLRFSATDFNSYVDRATATGAPQRQEGVMRASDAPGLGVEPLAEVVARPIARYA